MCLHRMPPGTEEARRSQAHAPSALDGERSARLEAIQELLSVDRDWAGIVDDDKTPVGGQGAT